MKKDNIQIRRALISVSDKTGIVELARALQAYDVEIISTGGTRDALEKAGVPVTDVAEVTGFPEMMDGRVKTLHPLIHGGLLGDRQKHAGDFKAHNITPIDLVVINLYPFEANPSIETIDIGGPAMLRASAKNHQFVTVISDAIDYDAFIQELVARKGATSFEFRKAMAYKAFQRTTSYDAAIQRWLSGEALPSRFILAGQKTGGLRYGENPHQQAAAYVSDAGVAGVLSARQIQGKELSYNNINDTDAAWVLCQEFRQPAVAIIKHASPCGVAVAATIEKAWEKALAGDPVSAFGGIVAINRPVTQALATALNQLFLEVVIAPGIDEKAAQILAKKSNLRVLLVEGEPSAGKRFNIKSVAGGFLVQEEDASLSSEKTSQVVTSRRPSKQEWADLLFAETVAKHVKSNAIVLARDGATVGIGGGQTSRLEAAYQAVRLAGDRATDAVAASDAFFPFADGLEILMKAGAAAVIQPGGSKRDEEVIAAAESSGITMVFTGQRHFRH